MKKFNLKRSAALILSAVALAVANSASSMCYWIFYDEVEMPKSLYKK